MKPPERDALSQLLHEWNDLPASRSGLYPDVREQIAAKEGTTRQGRWGSLRLWFDSTVRGRTFMIGCVAAGVIFGIVFAEGQAFAQRRRDQDTQPVRYLRWIDPLLAADMQSARR